jgi:hypothetical protein
MTLGRATDAPLVARPAASAVATAAPGMRGSLSQADPRRSRLFHDGTRLAFADLHNHSLLSDGSGQPEEAFATMRAAGLDVAALTDHARIGFGPLSRHDPCSRLDHPPRAQRNRCRAIIGLDEAGWARVGALADAADDPGAFVAIRGFEWTHPMLGHMNVWLSSRWIDALHTVGFGWDGIGEEAHHIPGLGPLLDRLLTAIPGDPGMRPVYDWLAADPVTGRIGGGLDGLAGFNHPGREPGRFDAFRYDARVASRLIGLEMFNRYDDFLFDGRSPSPLTACLDAGWRVGLVGVSDEHGDDWGTHDGKGRTGLWLRELSRAGVREALLARRFFATTLRDLRLDASANGTRMGGTLPHRRGLVTFEVDLDPGSHSRGQPLQVQVLRPGGDVPDVVHVEEVRLRSPGDPPLRFTLELAADDGRWVVLRIADPSAENIRCGPVCHPANRLGVAYASPFWLDPDLDREHAPQGRVTEVAER